MEKKVWSAPSLEALSVVDTLNVDKPIPGPEGPPCRPDAPPPNQRS